jgi:hypothetical protein
VPNVIIGTQQALKAWRTKSGPFSQAIGNDPFIVLAVMMNESGLSWASVNDDEGTDDKTGRTMKSWGPLSILDKYARELWDKRAKLPETSAFLTTPPTAPDAGNPNWGPPLTTFPSALGYALVKIALFTDFAYSHFIISGTKFIPKAPTSNKTLRDAELAVIKSLSAVTGGFGAAVAALFQLYNKGSSWTSVARTAPTTEGSRIIAKTDRAYVTLVNAQAEVNTAARA